jgi:hypothetical protein
LATLKELWAEFQAAQPETGIHVSTFEALEALRHAAPASTRRGQLAPERQVQGRFLDWLLYVKQEPVLAYEYLRRVGTVRVGPRQYWATSQGDRRAIAWESSHTYPGTDSEMWDLIYVDAQQS